MESTANGVLTTYEYDDNGNLTSQTTNGKETTYTWDDRNRLVEVNTADGDVVTYEYDDENIRVSSTVNGTKTTYLVDSNRPYAQVLEEYEDDNLKVRYVHGLDLISVERDGEVSVYLVDGLGSTRVLTDLDGEVVATYDYDAFGELLDSTGEVENDYLFAGEQFDGELEQYYLRQRFYDAGVGRFTRRDTYEGRIGEPVTLHKYIYANSNPVIFSDPTGLYSIAEANAVASIGNILNGLQLEVGNYLTTGILKGEDYSIGEFLRDLTVNGISEIVPFLGLFLGLAGGGNLGGSSFSSGGEEYVFRGDTRSPEEIFRDGFTAWDNNPNSDIGNEALRRHVYEFDSSPFIPATTDPIAARDFAGNGGYVYVIRRPANGRDVNAILGINSPEYEIAIPRRVDPSDILAAKPVGVSDDGYKEVFRGRIRINSRFRRR